MRSERRPRRVKAVKQRCSRAMWGIEDGSWQPPWDYENRDEGQELGSPSPLNSRGQLQSRELEQIVAKAWEGKFGRGRWARVVGEMV